MKKSTGIWATLLITAVCIAPAHSGIKKVAQTGLQFLKLDVGARAAAMGGAYMLVGDDATAMFYNPAGVAKMPESIGLFLGQTRWIADITYNTAALVKNLGNWGSVGLSAIYADYGGGFEGTQVATNEQGYIETGNIDVGAYAYGLTYARNLSDKFAVGGQIKYVGQKLGENPMPDGTVSKNSVSGLAYDFGTIFYPGFKSFRFGMSIRNFSREFKYEKEGFQLPLTFAIGAAMDVMDFFTTENHSLLVAVDALHPRDYSERLHIGAEYGFMKMFFARAGYKTNYDEEGLTLGAGFSAKISGLQLRLDYAYSDLGVFNAVNRFSVNFSF